LYSVTRTHAQRLAELLLGRPVIDWIAEQRPDGAETSYRHLARLLYEQTDGQVDVTAEALRRWHVTSQAASAGDAA
jgi:hypothetical protein